MQADVVDSSISLQQPVLLDKTSRLAKYVKSLTPKQLEKHMGLSKNKALKTYEMWQNWSDDLANLSPAIDSFIGDIYSGLQVRAFTEEDRAYANKHLYILSGLYGVLRALDSIAPYRLEMGYKFPGRSYKNLYTFWGDAIAKQLPADNTVINLSAAEYTKAVLPYMKDTRVITPKFMTMGKDGVPAFIVVHAKIARGAFARWLIQNRIESVEDIYKFDDLNYRYNPRLSSPEQPVFVCEVFGGLGLSIRLSRG
jgi:uncharacterized protein